MENSTKIFVPHPQFLDALFAFKNKVTTIFRDVLGLHEIDHISITRINQSQQLLTFSSTPAMEFNLFNSNLWHYDKTYNPNWFEQCTQAFWQTLYHKTRYDELYYLKQIKHSFPLGLSLAAKIDGEFIIYSLASHKACTRTREIFATRQEDFYKIGQYCSQMLNPLFIHCDLLVQQDLTQQVNHETSK